MSTSKLGTKNTAVAIVGGTGRLGHWIAKVFLSEYQPVFPIVRVLTRDTSSVIARELAAEGAELYALDLLNLEHTLREAFKQAGVVVNVLPSATTPKDVKKQVAATAINSGAKVYFLSEFGVDHRLNDFLGYDHHEWEVKRELAEDARVLAARAELGSDQEKTKVLAVYTGLFLESGLGPHLGFDISNNQLVCVGLPDQKTTFTSTVDIGRCVARLALLALDAATAPRVAEDVRIAGSVVSFEEVRDLLATIKGAEQGQIKCEDLGTWRRKLLNKEGTVPDYIRVLMGGNKLNLSEGSANELVNPGEMYWKWKTVEDQLRSG